MSFLGSIGKLLGGVVKAGLGVATGGISDVILGVGGSLLHHKSGNPVAVKASAAFGGVDKLAGPDKTGQLGGLFKRAASSTGRGTKGMVNLAAIPGTAEVLRASPVLPGGSISPMVAPTAFPKRRKKRKKSAKLARKVSSSKKRSRKRSGKLPKFGSPAWRKKFGLDKTKKRGRKR